MNCHQLQTDINRFKEEFERLKGAVTDAVRDGKDKDRRAANVLEATSTIYDELLASYYHDIRVENLKDPDHGNTEFLKSLTSLLPETKHPLLPETTINEVRDNLLKYLEDDPRLDSNLLTYALKEKVIEALRASNKLGKTETLSSIKDQPNIHLQDIVEILKDIYPPAIPETGNISRNTYLTIIAERVKNLETYETKHYIFMLPRDKWDDNRIPLPENSEGAYLTPSDLTAILKEPVYFDWNYETDGEVIKEAELVYDEKWIDREIRHFPWCKELFKTERNLLTPYGYHIPKRWSRIINAIKEQYRQKNGTKPSGNELAEILINDYCLGLSGCVRDASIYDRGSGGSYWSSTAYNSNYAYHLYLISVTPGTNNYYKYYGRSVRCLVAQSV